MMTSDERLTYMAAQILRNFAARGQAQAITATVEHIRLFWNPDMKARAAELCEQPPTNASDDVVLVFRALIPDKNA